MNTLDPSTLTSPRAYAAAVVAEPSLERRKCWVRQVSRREAERLLASGKYLSLAPDLGQREYVNQRTGQVVSAPVGIEPGWAYNPGQVSRLARAQQLLEEKHALGHEQSDGK